MIRREFFRPLLGIALTPFVSLRALARVAPATTKRRTMQDLIDDYHREHGHEAFEQTYQPGTRRMSYWALADALVAHGAVRSAMGVYEGHISGQTWAPRETWQGHSSVAYSAHIWIDPKAAGDPRFPLASTVMV